jgi:hypothetical protein
MCVWKRKDADGFSMMGKMKPAAEAVQTQLLRRLNQIKRRRPSKKGAPLD